MKAVSVIGIVAIAFGALTVVSGGTALIGGEAVRGMVGNAVPFVLWFNFLAGFAYIVAGVGLLKRAAWSAPLALLLAAATVAVFAAFGIAVWLGSPFEMRTVGAMTLRSVFWCATALIACRALGCFNRADRAG